MAPGPALSLTSPRQWPFLALLPVWLVWLVAAVIYRRWRGYWPRWVDAPPSCIEPDIKDWESRRKLPLP